MIRVRPSCKTANYFSALRYITLSVYEHYLPGNTRRKRNKLKTLKKKWRHWSSDTKKKSQR